MELSFRDGGREDDMAHCIAYFDRGSTSRCGCDGFNFHLTKGWVVREGYQSRY